MAPLAQQRARARARAFLPGLPLAPALALLRALAVAGALGRGSAHRRHSRDTIGQSGDLGAEAASLGNASARFVSIDADVGSVLRIYDLINDVASIVADRQHLDAIAGAEMVAWDDPQDSLELESENLQANLEMLDAIDGIMESKLGFRALQYQCHHDIEAEKRACLHSSFSFNQRIEHAEECSIGLKEIVNELHIIRSELFLKSYQVLTKLSGQSLEPHDAEASPEFGAGNSSIVGLDQDGVATWLREHNLGEFPELDEAVDGRMLSNLAARGMLRLFLGRVRRRGSNGDMTYMTDMTDEEAVNVYCTVGAAVGRAPSGSCSGSGIQDLHTAAKEKLDPWVFFLLKSANGNYKTPNWQGRSLVRFLGFVEKVVDPGRWGTLLKHSAEVRDVVARTLDSMTASNAIQTLFNSIGPMPPGTAMLSTSIAAVKSMTFLYNQFQRGVWTDCERARALFTRSSIWRQIQDERNTEGPEI